MNALTEDLQLTEPAGAIMEAIEAIPNDLDALDVPGAVQFLNSLGMDIAVGTFYKRIAAGRGPRRFKRQGRWYFAKVDLVAWKKKESKAFEAYR